MSRTSLLAAMRLRNDSGNWSSRGEVVARAKASVRPGGEPAWSSSARARSVARARARATKSGSSGSGPGSTSAAARRFS